MLGLPNAVVYGKTVNEDFPPETERIFEHNKAFYTQSGKLWNQRGHSSFLLYRNFLLGQDIDPVLTWYRGKGANLLRVLGMVGWKDYAFGPNTPGFWENLPVFADYIAKWGFQLEFVVFADAQIVLPNPNDQKNHLTRVVSVIGGKWNMFIEICNEPWQNGCVPTEIWDENSPRPCLMAYGDYQDNNTLRVLDYLTFHSPRDPDAFSRKAKDGLEYRDGPMGGGGVFVATTDDEPIGAADKPIPAGKQRSSNSDDFFWHHAVATILYGNSTFHSDAGLTSVVPDPAKEQEQCANAVTEVWKLVGPEWQKGRYTRSGLADLPLIWEKSMFPEQTSRIYCSILGNKAVCIAVKPNTGWVAVAAPGWKIISQHGPMETLVFLERA